ncbi:hypothetical protein [Roseixanthobacter liquoris]|uniref:hypothetical protein n=1 Tax=Roseixanthobacter liquoris TaxID=3119921 RepID=UPI00372A1984
MTGRGTARRLEGTLERPKATDAGFAFVGILGAIVDVAKAGRAAGSASCSLSVHGASGHPIRDAEAVTPKPLEVAAYFIRSQGPRARMSK